MLQGQGMRAAEMLVWLGDFNYRVNCSYDDAKDYIQQGWIKELLAKVHSKSHFLEAFMLTHKLRLRRFWPLHRAENN